MMEYVTAEIEIIEFSEEDVISTSGLFNGGNEGSIGGDGDGGDAGIWSLRNKQ